jgi:hypothetical protein
LERWNRKYAGFQSKTLKSAQIAISRAINEYRRIAKVSAPDDELSLQSHMLVPVESRPASPNTEDSIVPYQGSRGTTSHSIIDVI